VTESEAQAIVAAIWGIEKSGKSSLAMTFPRPMIHFDLDVGGFNRAAWRLDTKDITTKSYMTPMQIDKMLGAHKDNGIPVRASKKVEGMIELWQAVIVDYIKAVQDPNVKTIIIDSATQLWNICHRSYLQSLQEKQLAQGEKDQFLRAQLLPIEYAEPNERMKTFVFTSRSYKKNLVLTHYPKDVYAPRFVDGGMQEVRTGEEDIDGFKQTKALADVAIRTFQVKNNGDTKMMAKVTLSGLGKGLEGMEIEDPTFEKLLKLIKMVRGE
jgi:hypothetical protein